MIGEIKELPLKKIDWVILGGESGFNSRPLSASWVISVRNQCINAEVPFFFKQWGGVNKKKNGRELNGEIWSQQPEQKKLKIAY